MSYHVMSLPFVSGHLFSCYPRSCHGMTCRVILRHASSSRALVPCHTMLSRHLFLARVLVTSSRVMFSRVMSCHVQSYYVVSCHVMSRDRSLHHGVSVVYFTYHVLSPLLVLLHVLPSIISRVLPPPFLPLMLCLVISSRVMARHVM